MCAVHGRNSRQTPQTALGRDEPRPQFFAKARDIDLDRVALDFRPKGIQGLFDIRLGNHSTGMPHQAFQHRPFPRRQDDIFGPAADLSVGGVYYQRAKPQDRTQLAGIAPGHRSHAGAQLVQVKGFDKVIIGPGIQPLDPRGNLVMGGQDRNRRLVPAAVLAFFPVQDSFAPTVQAVSGISVAILAARVAAQVPDVQAIHRKPSGRIEVDYANASGAPQKANVDATTGVVLGAETGIARIFGRAKGQTAGRLHSTLSRLAVLPFVLSALTGTYTVLTEFDLVPVVSAQSQAYPASADYSGPAVSPGSLQGLATVPLADLRDLQFPYQGDPTDVFTLKTDAGQTLIDQFSGAVLEQVLATTSERVYAWFYALHIGEGMAWMGAVLGLAPQTDRSRQIRASRPDERVSSAL